MFKSTKLAVVTVCTLSVLQAQAQSNPRIFFKTVDTAAKALETPPGIYITSSSSAEEMDKLKLNTRFLIRSDSDDDLGCTFVALAQMQPDRSAILNPQFKGTFIELDYIGISKNSELTKEFCDSLWGVDISKTPAFSTYRLVTPRTKAPLPIEERKEFFIDTVFVDQKLKSYRIRGSEIISTAWKIAN